MGKGRAPCCDKNKVKKGPWSPEEDLRLITFVQKHGHGNWRSLPKQAGLLRCGKSCRLRWINYLRPDLKRGNVTKEEEETIIMLHQSFGNKWSKIATYLPGRTDNEIKNVWNTHLKKRLIKKEGDGNHHKDEIKSLSKSSSFSLSSSSSSTSLISPNDNQNIVEALESSTPKMAQELLNVEVLEKKKGNDEVKEYSSSSNSSYATNNCSNSSLNDTDCMPIDDMDFWINAEYGKNFEPSLSQDQDIEIFPLQIDGGFWEMLDDLDPMILKELEISQTNFGEENGRNFEVGKWMKNLENELGLEATSEGQNVAQND